MIPVDGDSAIHAEYARPAIEDLHDYLSGQPELAAASQQLLETESERRLLTFGGVPFCRYLRPHMITRAQYAVIKEVVETLATAMVKLRRAALSDERLMDLLDLSPEERRLAAIDPGFEEPSPSSRLDSFWSERDWRFVEINAESPAAIAYEDGLAELFLELPAIERWQMEHGYRLVPLMARTRFLNAVRDMWKEFRSNRSGFGTVPNVAIVDWAGVPTSSEFELFQRYFEENGLSTRICTPEELEMRGGRLYARDFRVDIYYKRVLTSELLVKPEVAAPTLRAYEEGAVCLFNSFRAKLLHKKMSLALMHDEANAGLFTRHELEVIRAHVPWTRKVAEARTSFAGREVDLVPFIERNREQFVLKPNDEYGGKGVSIGWTMSDSDWLRSLEEALEGSYVVQSAVQLEQEPFPYFDGEHGLCFRDVTADLDPFVFGTETQGMLTRLSAAALLNVTAGTGSVVPTMIVEKLDA